jgi:competence ComEA-like helix-hairpin-helix protein
LGTSPAEPVKEIETPQELPEWLLEEEPTHEAVPTGPVAQAEPAEEIPSWLFEEVTSEEVEKVEAGLESSKDIGEAGEVIPMEASATSLDVEEELPDWLFEEEPSPSLEDTQPTKVSGTGAKPVEEIEIEEASAGEGVVSEVPASEATAEPPQDMEDTDAAFAWLESLAVKQGAEEALLLRPEERREEPPEWVQKSAQAEIVEAEEEITHVEAEPVEAEAEGAETIGQEAPMDEEAAFAWLESLAAKQGVEEALLSKPEERSEEPPEWVKESAQREASEEEISAIEAEESISSEEISVLEPPEIEQPIEAPVAEEETKEAEPQIPSDMDEEAAFAWLESLAVKQGAEEALLLEPEERREEPPKWISEELSEATVEEESEAVESIEAEIEAEVEVEPTELAPPGAEITSEEISSEDELVMAVEELFPEEIEEEAIGMMEETVVEEEGLLEKEEMEEILAMLDEEAPPAEMKESPLETAEEEIEPQEPEPFEEVPELPDWLSGPMPRDTGELEWKPPPIRLDINKASLIEFERLMGVGFRLAQQIINYRDVNGPFRRVEDLEDVPGFDPAILESIHDHLYVTLVPETVSAEELTPLFTPTEGIPSELIEIRAILIDGDLEEALEKYAQMIDAEQHIPRLVEDLQDITDRYPENLNALQYLGDAYLRLNQVHEALKSYIKAEELLR